MTKVALWTDTDAEVRKLGERTGLDTLVVLAVNDGYWVWGVEPLCRSKRDKYPAWGVRSQE